MGKAKRRHELSRRGRILLIIAIVFCGWRLCDHFIVKTTGNKASDAIITTMDGKKVSHKEKLDKYLSYQVKYHWQVRRLRPIKEGTKVRFYLPNNVRLNTSAIALNVYDDHHRQIGIFQLDKKASYGVLTFNKTCQKARDVQASGDLVFTVNGTHERQTKQWMINQIGWIGDNGNPSWQIVFNPEGKKLTQVYVTNVREGNQTYDKDSIELRYGYVNKQNQFITQKVIDNPIQQGLITITGDQQNTIVAHLKNIHQAIQITYQTELEEGEDVNLSNTADATCNEQEKSWVTASIQLKGSDS